MVHFFNAVGCKIWGKPQLQNIINLEAWQLRGLMEHKERKMDLYFLVAYYNFEEGWQSRYNRVSP